MPCDRQSRLKPGAYTSFPRSGPPPDARETQGIGPAGITAPQKLPQSCPILVSDAEGGATRRFSEISLRAPDIRCSLRETFAVPERANRARRRQTGRFRDASASRTEKFPVKQGICPLSSIAPT